MKNQTQMELSKYFVSKVGITDDGIPDTVHLAPHHPGQGGKARVEAPKDAIKLTMTESGRLLLVLNDIATRVETEYELKR